MIRPFECSIADANDIHEKLVHINKYVDLTKQFWHRKLWEYLYISEQFNYWSQDKQDLACLGFGCGLERIPFILADNPSVDSVIISDEPLGKTCWSSTGQHIDSVAPYRKLAEELGMLPFIDKFSYVPIDMNRIGIDRSVDFIWSTSSLEHLGSMENSIRFLIESSKLLTTDGLAVHATEYNLSSNTATRLTGDSIYFRMQDIVRLRDVLNTQGFELGLLNIREYIHPFNSYTDTAPYPTKPSHIKLLFDGYVLTSIGLCIRRAK